MTSYFISQEVGANDSNSGLSELLPWLTIAKINSSTFNAGDDRRLKDGYKWREALTEPSDGSSGNPIILTRYGGTGGRPILDGADVVTGFTTSYATGSNGCTNPGFETDTTGWTTPFGHGSITRDTSQFYSGSASALVVRGNSGDARIARYAVPSPASYTAGKYIVSARVKPNATLLAANRQRLYFQGIRCYLETDGTFSETQTCLARPVQRLGDWQGGSGWQLTFAVFDISVAPTSVFNLNFGTVSGGASADGEGFYLDDVEVRAITAGDLTYSVAPGFTPLGAWLNETTGLLGGLNGVSTLRLCENKPGTYWITGGTIHVHLLNHADPAGYTVDVGRRARPWNNNNARDYLRVTGVQAQHAGANGKGIAAESGIGIEYIDCVSRHNNQANFQIYTTSGTVAGGIVQFCQSGAMDREAISNFNAPSIWCMGLVGGLIDRNYITSTNGQSIRGRANGAGTEASTGCTVQYNQCIACYWGPTWDGQDHTFTGNYVANGSSCGMQPGKLPAATGTNFMFVRNVLWDLQMAPDAAGYNGMDSNGASNSFLYHNTIVNVSVRSATFEENGGTANDNWTVKNNIFDAYDNYSNAASTSGWGGPIYIEDTVTGCVFDYNCYREVNTGGTDRVVDYEDNGLKTWAQWQGLGNEANGVIADPLFVNAAGGDLRTALNSPCRRAGVFISGVSPNTTPDIGAKQGLYSYQYSEVALRFN